MSRSNVTSDVTDALLRWLRTSRSQDHEQGLNRTLTKRSGKFNLLKKRTLQVFDRAGGWLDVQAFAVRAGFYPIRAAYSYLRRLSRYGLLHRARDARGRLVYRLSRRGRERLAWLDGLLRH